MAKSPKKIKKTKLQKKKEDPNSRYWRNKADYEWRVLIHRSNVCAICGATEKLQAHHLIPREIKSLRHDPDNGILLCVRNHKYDYMLSAHKNPLSFAAWLQTNHPKKWEWVQSTLEKLTKADPWNYQEAYLRLKAINDAR